MTIRPIGARGGDVAGPSAWPPETAVTGFLEALHGGTTPGLTEVRFRRSAGGMGQCFFDPAELAHASRVIVGLGSRTDTYVGVTPRLTASGRRSAVPEASVVWADCDTPEASSRLGDVVPQPSMVVRSGSEFGRHAYWLLDRTLPIDAIETLNRRLALALGADGRSTDGARVLRPPATRNFKYQPPGPVVLERLDVDARCGVDELARRLPRLSAPAPVRLPPRTPGGDPLRSIPPATYARVLLGIEVGRSRKIRCPFHPDRTPSLHVYPTPEQGWYCFGCGRGTSIYDMAAAVWGTGTRGQDFIDLRERLRALFGVARG